MFSKSISYVFNVTSQDIFEFKNVLKSCFEMSLKRVRYMKICFDAFNNFLEHAAQQPTYVFDIIPEMGSMMFEKCCN